MKISIHNHQSDVTLCEKEITKLILALISLKKISTDEVDIYFVDKEAIAKIHHQAFNDLSPTDCITFPMDPLGNSEDHHYLGEAFICPQVALEYALSHDGNVYKEISLYITHCFLHFLGYEDATEKKAIEMRQQEQKCLSHLKNRGLLLKESLSIQ